jgi:hypothetical protein
MTHRALIFWSTLATVSSCWFPAHALEARPAATPKNRTLVVGVEVDRTQATVVAYTVKDRPWRAPDQEPAPRAIEAGGAIQLEVQLIGPNAEAVTRRLEIAGLCFDHGPEAAAHIEGDTVRLHRESFLVELPEWAGYDQIEVSYHRQKRGTLERLSLGRLPLTAAVFTPAGSDALYSDLAFASSSVTPGEVDLFTAGTVHWPEEYGETERYKIYGNPLETEQRVNIVLVPDGYTHAEKALLESHAQSLVNYFRSKTPYAEHDPFINYTLVYAYSTQSATDQCDCNIVRDTAMNTRFPQAGYPCSDSGNRCLYYGTGNGGPNCDPNTSSANIVAAELRAPAKDVTLIMVNTTRYGGCGGARAVYAAGNSSATEIAVHELGHSLAGLADEYESYSTCGTSAGEINSSLNASQGAWPEWIGEIGAPVRGAQYYSQCIYRPTFNCDMRALNVPFCPVCNQRFSLTFFGHPRVAPTAPILSASPAPPVQTTVGKNVDFSVATRLAIGGNVTNSLTWQLQGPGFPTPTTIATGSPLLTRSFTDPGEYTLSCEVIADTNFIKPVKTAANRDVTSWTVSAAAIAEVSSGPGAPQLTVTKTGSTVTLTFQDVGANSYNVYVSNTPNTGPFKVANAATGKKDCAVAVTTSAPGVLQVNSYNPDAGISGDRSLLSILVTADNGASTEATLGLDSSGGVRAADAYCNR